MSEYTVRHFPVVDDSRRVHEKICAAGGESELEIWPHVFHGWQMLDGLVPEARMALDRSAAFILRHLEAPRGMAGEMPRTDTNYPALPNQTTG